MQALIASGVARDHLARRADHHFMHEPFHQHFAVPPLDRHRVVVGALAHQRHRCHVRQALVAGFVRRCRQGQQPLPVFSETITDRFFVPAQFPRSPLPALGQKIETNAPPAAEFALPALRGCSSAKYSSNLRAHSVTHRGG